MAEKKYQKPVYELIADGMASYLVTFPPIEPRNRHETAKSFVSSRFTGHAEYTMRILRPREYGEIGAKQVIVLGENGDRQEI